MADSDDLIILGSRAGGFDHRAIDAADGARQKQGFKPLMKASLGGLA